MTEVRMIYRGNDKMARDDADAEEFMVDKLFSTINES